MRVHVAIAFSFIFHVLVLGLLISLCDLQRIGAMQEPRPLFITLSSVSGPAEEPGAGPGNGVEQAPKTGDAAPAKEPGKAAPRPEEMKKRQEPKQSHKKRLPKKSKAVKPQTEPESVDLARSESRSDLADEVEQSEFSSYSKASLDGSSVGEGDFSPASGSAGLLDEATRENTGFSGRGPVGGGAGVGGGASRVGNDGQPFKEAVPAYRKNPLPEYPPAARRRGHEGTVVLNVLVDREGRVKDLSVFRSSQHRALDGAALETVKNWVFEPAMRGEQMIEMWVRVPVCFQLK